MMATVVTLQLKAHGRVERLLSFSVVQQWRAAGKSCCVDAVNWDDVDSVVWVAGGGHVISWVLQSPS